MTTRSPCSGSTPERSSAASIATPPSSVASSVDRPPPILPMGVRAAPRITVLGIGCGRSLSREKGERQAMLVDRSSAPGEPCRACGRICRRADIVPGTVQVSATTQPASATDADTVVVGLFDSEQPSAAVPAEVGKLIESGEAKGSFKALALTHTEGKRWLTVGLGARKDFTPEHARVAAAVARERARELAGSRLCWLAPIEPNGDSKRAAEISSMLVEFTILADYRFDLHKSKPAGEKQAAKHREKLMIA